MTEAVPLLGHLQWSKTYEFADSFHMAAVAGNPAMRTFIYETWHCTTTGTPTGCNWDNDDGLLWRPRLTADFPLWTGIMDTLKNRHPGAPIWMVPAGQAFGNLVDSIAAGAVPGISDFKQLFSDDIHLTDVGNYFVACVMYSCIFRDSPIGLAGQTFDEWGQPFSDIPSPVLALKLQQTAWQTVVKLGNRTGVQGISGVSGNGVLAGLVEIFPNPSPDGRVHLFSKKSTISSVEVFDFYGRKVFQKGFLPANEVVFELPKNGAGQVFFIKTGLADGTFDIVRVVKM